ncbi:hypothetical protein H0H81_006565 [Sphagnurus paluster]|uniref:Uncharacterized protein n=1 Tax=Sphagnurus paluster TaxID=117069 RepID=A0A9P7GTF2_9AGAR|nr:hypothetical protein H0H81_006565 [Sphagnurus paluster]
MGITLPEQRRVKITVDTHSTPLKLQSLAASRPFTRQVDVVFSSSAILESTLVKLQTRYSTGRVRLAEVVDSTGAFANFFLQPEGCFTMLSTCAHTDDVWCIDPRGILTLLVAKDTYERLGLLGKKLPFKAHADTYVIRIPLQRNAESTANRVRWKEALKLWDARRESEGTGAWDVLYSSNDSNLPEPQVAEMHVQEVHCQARQFADVHVPTPTLRQHPILPQTTTQQVPANEEIDDWETEMVGLFEWVGMACLGSQRLNANDRADPYVALYECPEPSHVGSLTHLRWKGFVGPTFLQSIINTVLASLKTLSPDAAERPFVAITAHACTASPVTYIPPGPRSGDGPVRLARTDGEDTWCLFAMPGSVSQSLDWAMVESLGQYDTRWG